MMRYGVRRILDLGVCAGILDCCLLNGIKVLDRTKGEGERRDEDSLAAFDEGRLVPESIGAIPFVRLPGTCAGSRERDFRG